MNKRPKRPKYLEIWFRPRDRGLEEISLKIDKNRSENHKDGCLHENLDISELRIAKIVEEEYVIIEFDYFCEDCGKYIKTIQMRYIFDSVINVT